MKTKIGYFSIGIVLALLLGLSSGRAEMGAPMEDWILERAVAVLGFVPDAVQKGDLQRIEFPLTGTELYRVKLVDTKTDEAQIIVMDEAGQTRDLEDARLAEEAAHDARLAQLLAEDSDLSVDAAMAKLEEAPHGRLSNNLLDLLETMDAAGSLAVAIWLRADNVQPIERPDTGHRPADAEAGEAALEPRVPGLTKGLGQSPRKDSSDAQADRVEAIRQAQDEVRFEIEDYRQQNLDHLRSQITLSQAPLLADLSAMGFNPVYVSPLSPIVWVQLPKSAILEMVLKDYVDTIYGPNINRDMMNTAKPTQKADIVDNWFGFDGTGVDVAHCEDSRVDWPHTYLITGTTRVPGHSNVDNHATACTGMVSSQHGTYQGIAQGPNMFSANGTSYSDANMSAAMDWAATTQGVDVMNHSWGGNDTSGALNVHDRHIDYLVRNSACTATISAGNSGAVTHFVGSPGKAYNAITVGAYGDNATLTWDDDAIASYSSFNNPSTNVEKPEVAASGSLITSTLMNNGIGYAGSGSGTSFAAPMVAGEAALLMDRSSTLETWPEAVKAIIMATALHNIEGASRLSSKDGAGGVDMRAAFRTVDEGWWYSQTVYATTTPATHSMYAYAGQTIRAAIAWDSNPNSSYTTDPLEADIDLRLKFGSTTVATSSYIYNNFEIIEYAVPTTGTYTLEPYVFSFTGTSYTYMGVAWWTGNRVLAAYGQQTLGTPPVSRDYYQFPASSFWNAVAIRPVSGADHDLYLYANSAWGDPDDYDYLASSGYGGSAVDFVLVDRNHGPSGNYYPEVRNFSGSGNYTIEWATHTADTADLHEGTHGPYTMTASDVIRVWDSNVSSTARKYFAVKPVSGNADLAMALYDSDPAVSSTWYRYRGNWVAYADSAGAGGAEFMNYLTSTTDWMGLVVWNDAATTTTSFYLYTDTTSPTGSIVINGGAATTTSPNVTLTLSAVDSQTGVAEMRFLNSGSTWSAWETYNTTKAWTLTSGDGTKTVYAQYRNNAMMTSSAYSDTIVLDTTGWLRGTVRFIGLPCRSGGTVPPCDGLYPGYAVKVYKSDGVTIAGQVTTNTSGYYSIGLPAGNYIVYEPSGPFGQLTHAMSIVATQYTTLNMAIDKGIRSETPSPKKKRKKGKKNKY